LLVHGLSAAFLWGALTHQALAVSWPAQGGRGGWWMTLRSVRAERYARAIVILFCSTVALGALLYPPFRLVVRAAYLDQHVPWGTGLFELKEHVAAIGLTLLPLYWAAWRDPEATGARRASTLALAALVWFNFLAGHVVNNLRGL
jgi:hypothetical protein